MARLTAKPGERPWRKKKKYQRPITVRLSQEEEEAIENHPAYLDQASLAYEGSQKSGRRSGFAAWIKDAIRMRLGLAEEDDPHELL